MSRIDEACRLLHASPVAVHRRRRGAEIRHAIAADRRHHGGNRRQRKTRADRQLADIKTLQSTCEDLFHDVIAAGQKDTSFRQQSVSVTANSVIALLNAPIFWHQPRANDTASTHRDIAAQIARMALGTTCLTPQTADR